MRAILAFLSWCQLVVPSVYRRQILRVGHEAILAGHLGVKRTADRILRNFFWPGIFGHVTRLCQSCEICEWTVNRGSVKVAPVPLMPVVDIPFDLIDRLSPPTDKHQRRVLALIDCATRYP